MKKILVVMLVYLIFPCYGWSTEPPKSLINRLINDCFNDTSSDFANDNVKVGSIQSISDASDSIYADNDRLSEADKANGITYRKTHRIQYIYQQNNTNEWEDGKSIIYVSIKNGILRFEQQKEDAFGGSFSFFNPKNCIYTVNLNNKNAEIIDEAAADRNKRAAKASKEAKDMTAKNAVPQHTTDIAKANEKAKQSEDYSPAPPPNPVPQQIVAAEPTSKIVRKPEWFYLKTNVALPYMPITEKQWNEIINVPYVDPTRENYKEFPINLTRGNSEELSAGTAYEIFHNNTATSSFTAFLITLPIINHNGQLLIPVTLTSGIHKRQKVLISLIEYGLNFKDEKRITAN